VSAACLACRIRPASEFDLCRECLFQLPSITRARLRQRDHDVQNRLFQLLSALHRRVPLGRIEVAA
jgi:hypothetical protein